MAHYLALLAAKSALVVLSICTAPGNLYELIPRNINFKEPRDLRLPLIILFLPTAGIDDLLINKLLPHRRSLHLAVLGE